MPIDPVTIGLIMEGVAIAASAVSSAFQASAADESADISQREVRQQQVQLQLQKNQQDILRTRKLREQLATSAVTFGTGGVAGVSQNMRAIINRDIHNYNEDVEVSNLNYASKKQALFRESQQIEARRKAGIVAGASSFAATSASAASNMFELSRLPTGKYKG